VQNDLTNFGTGPVQSILYYASSSSLDTKANGDDGGASWTRYTGQPQLAAFGGSYKMTPSPAGREYLFGCPNAVPTMYVFSEATNSITGTWTDSASTCSSLFIDGSNNVSLISSEEDGDYVRVVFPQVQTTQSGTAWQSLHLENIHVTGGDNDFTFSKISENVITAAAGAPSSIVLATLIEPDMIEVPRSLQSNAALLYWVESNGPLSGGVAPAGTTVTNNGMLIRDLNLWAPIIPVVQNDGNGNPLYWSGWSQGGDYRRAAFAYDGASNTLNFFPYWVGSDNATWNTNFIVAHP